MLAVASNFGMNYSLVAVVSFKSELIVFLSPTTNWKKGYVHYSEKEFLGHVRS